MIHTTGESVQISLKNLCDLGRINVSHSKALWGDLHGFLPNILFIIKAALTILFGWQGPPTLWNYARREKKIDISLLFLFFPPTCPEVKGFFFQNCINSDWICLFLLLKVTFQLFFYFFLRPESKCKFLFFFFPSDEAQTTLVGARQPNNIVRVA